MNAICICTDAESEWVGNAVRLVDGDESMMLPQDPEVPCLTMQITGMTDNRYRIRMDGCEVIETEHPLYMALMLIKRYSVMDPAYHGLHAATVEYENVVCTFMAVTGTGKTSLAGFLCGKGASLYGDDLTLLCKKSQCVYPTYRPIMLRQPSLELLDSYGVPVSKRAVPVTDGEYDRYMFNHLAMADTIRKIDMMFVIHVDPLHRIQRVEDERDRMQWILKNAMRPEKLTMPYLQFVQALSQIPMYEVWYQDFNWLLEEIRKIIAKQ